MVFPIGAAMKLMQQGHSPQHRDPDPDGDGGLPFVPLVVVAFVLLSLLAVLLVLFNEGDGDAPPYGICSTGTHVVYVHHGRSTTSYCEAGK